MKLIAKTTIRYGAKGETAAPGETFELDEREHADSAKQLLESGAAELPAKPAPKDPAPKGKD